MEPTAFTTTSYSEGDLEAGLNAFMTEKHLTRKQAVHHILRAWLSENGYLQAGTGADNADLSQPDPLFVQYPGYFKDGGSL